jgi:carbon-monoxide dehydrogenase medium subunit
MYSPQFDYIRATSVAEAISLLGQHNDAKLLAGGHSLLPLVKMRLASPEIVIDIGRIDDLKGISEKSGMTRIGALTTHATIAASDQVPRALSEAAGIVGDPQVRNRGTIGGNVAHADPASDLPTVLIALNATFHVTGPSGERSVAADDFFIGLFKTALNDGEILTDILVPAEGEGTGSAYAKLPNLASQYAMVGAAAALATARGNCTAAQVAVGGLTSSATRVLSVEESLVGNRLDAETIAAAAEAVQDDLGSDIIGDIHASAEYRKAMVTVYLRRALTAAAERAAM